MKLTANILARNEQDNIERCLRSIAPYVSEIIVVLDSRSNDNTETICRSLGVNVYRYEWKDDSFSDARNFAIDHSHGDYILIIDADEILERFIAPPENYDYYVCSVRIDNERFKDSSFRSIRIFRNTPQIRYDGKRHGIVDYACKNLSGLDIPQITFLHPELSKAELDAKMKKNLKIHLWQRKNEQGNEMINYHLTRTYFYYKNWHKVIRFGIKVLSDKVNKEIKAETCIMIYVAFYYLNDRDKGLIFLMLSLKLLPVQVRARFLLLEIFKEQKNETLYNQTLEEITELSTKRMSNLNTDYFFTKQELENYKN